jgi:hypothetical protein
MTPKPSDVRLARPGDEELLFALICASDEEWSLGPRDDDKVRDVVAQAIFGGAPSDPKFGVIRGPSVIEAFIGLFPTEPWNSREMYLRAFSAFVHPLYRRSTHANHLIDFADWFGDMAGLVVIHDLLHPIQTEAKMRLYGRKTTPIGGLFVHGLPAVRKKVAA